MPIHACDVQLFAAADDSETELHEHHATNHLEVLTAKIGGTPLKGC